jgi:hypothetical protein
MQTVKPRARLVRRTIPAAWAQDAFCMESAPMWRVQFPDSTVGYLCVNLSDAFLSGSRVKV